MAIPSKLTQADRQRIGQDYAAGETVAILATTYGVSEARIRQVYKEQGVATRPRERHAAARVADADMVTIARRYADGEGCATIARSYDVSTAFVHNRLRALGIATRPPGHNSKRKLTPQQEALLPMRYGEMRGSSATVGAMFGVTAATVRRALDRLGVDRHLRHEDGHGYIRVRCPPEFAAMAKCDHHGTLSVLEHRLVMAQHLGRPLLPGESVHHINGVKNDNRPANLQLRARRHGPGQSWRCADCGSHRIEPVPLT